MMLMLFWMRRNREAGRGSVEAKDFERGEAEQSSSIIFKPVRPNVAAEIIELQNLHYDATRRPLPPTPSQISDSSSYHSIYNEIQ